MPLVGSWPTVDSARERLDRTKDAAQFLEHVLRGLGYFSGIFHTPPLASVRAEHSRPTDTHIRVVTPDDMSDLHWLHLCGVLSTAYTAPEL